MTMARPRDVDHVQVVGGDHAVEMDIDEIQTWRCAPMAKQSRFNMLESEWLSEQRVIE